MLRTTCFLVVVQVVLCQNRINLTNGDDRYEVVSPKALESIEAIDKCGEGADTGVHRCVSYHQCNPADNIINEVDTEVVDLRAGGNTCDHYLDVCCGVPQPQKATTSTSTTPKPVSTKLTPSPREPTSSSRQTPNPRNPTRGFNNKPCGIRNGQGIDFKILGNTDEAEYGEFPWIVALLEKNANQTGPFSFCGGSLITPNAVLTAAHCVYKYSANEIKIRAGEWDAQTDKERVPEQERNVSRIILHEDFDIDVLYNDIAVLILANPVELVETVGTVCLPTQNQDVQSKTCFAGGWGKDAFGSKGQYQMILKKVELPLVDRSRCLDALRTTRLGKHFVLHESFRCAGGEEGKDTCKGDGGGPLACPVSTVSTSDGLERYIQTGIIAWGIACGDKDIPGVYTDVTKYRNWIDRQMDQYGIDKNIYTL